MHRFPFLVLLAVASVLLGACQESNPVAPGESGNPDVPGPGSSIHESGAVESARLSGSDPSQMTIVLGGNVEVRITDATLIDAGGDLTTLEEVLAAIDAGVPVRIEIDGTVAGGVITASRVRFETDGVGAADDEVHAVVADVDVGARTVTLADGRAIRVTSDALIEPDGDFVTLAQVATALAGGLEVRMEAHLGPITGGVREATSAKFESDQADGTDDDGIPGEGGDEVHGIVSAIDLAVRTVTLADGRAFRVVTDSAIETDGDFRTLASVADALAAGLEVRVEADLGAAGASLRDATSAKFESDQADGPDDDADDDNSGPGRGGDDDNSGPGHGGDDDNSGHGGDDDNSGPGHGDDDDDDDGVFDDDEVEGMVASVDLAARTVTTSSGRVIRIATDAMIEADGDILTLAEVATRLASGAPVRVEADGASADGVFVAQTAKFEVDD
jgi:hypothetical protein